jgi:hypothetical protein
MPPLVKAVRVKLSKMSDAEAKVFRDLLEDVLAADAKGRRAVAVSTLLYRIYVFHQVHHLCTFHHQLMMPAHFSSSYLMLSASTLAQSLTSF